MSLDGSRLRTVVCLLLFALASSPAAAQELEPRAYSRSPVGANFAAIGYAYSWGSILFDPAVPITDAEGRIHGYFVGYGRTFAIAGREVLATAAMPYARGSFNGRVVQRDSSTTRSGAADLRAKLSVNLVGGQALSPGEFARAPAQPVVVGVSLTVSAPTGQYYPSRLINIGTNRWAFKPEVGLSYNWRRRWYADVYGGVWYFTANPSFYPGGSRRQQDALVSTQGHLSYTFANRSWIAFESTWYNGGASHTNGGPASTRLDNARLGALLALQVAPRQSLKIGYNFGPSARVGSNFETVAVAYQLLWF